jgi:8-oxo-dGTP pyrophosphatase MutT (NUDIX family)
MEDSSDSKATPEVSLIQVTNGSGHILFGKRNDNGLWTLPGGHLEEGEDPELGAIRELHEETGLVPKSLTFLRTVEPRVPGAPRIHCYTALCSGDAHSANDPDDECSEWEWVDVKGGIPSKIWNHLHGPPGDANVVREAFEMKKAEAIKGSFFEGEECLYDSADECPDIDCSHNNLEKAESEASLLLQHPNPVERALALKLSTTTPRDVATAALDHDPIVWHQALVHPDGEHARGVVANSTRDLCGCPLWAQHDALLADPSFPKHHVSAMYDAVLGDKDLDEQTRAARLDVIARHPSLQLKKHWGHDKIYGASDFSTPLAPTPTAAEHEETMPHLRHLEAAYQKHIAPENAPPPIKNDAEYHGYSPKVVYEVPVDGEEKTQRFMVKPYHESGDPRSGWAEASSQALYHAAGLGHLHQKSFVAAHGHGESSRPVTVIHIENAEPVLGQTSKAVKAHPTSKEDARKIALMDFLTNNGDRHDANILARQDGSLLAIDHGLTLVYGPYSVKPYSNFGTKSGIDNISPWDPYEHAETLKWWPQVAGDVRRAFAERLRLLKKPADKEQIHNGFEKRARWLDAAAKTALAGGQPDFDEPLEPTPGLQKTMADVPLHEPALQGNEPQQFKGSHVGFIGKHPEAANAGVEEFETHIAKSPNQVPAHRLEDGLEPKAVYKGPQTKFLVKPYHSPFSQEAGWNELTSQALYHAAGLGHLHQNSHVTEHGDEKTPGLVIHMGDDYKTLGQDYRENNTTPPSQWRNKSNEPPRGSRVSKTISNPEHLESLRRIALMDHLTASADRHSENLMVNNDGQPLVIDNSFAFGNHHNQVYGHNEVDDLYGSPDFDVNPLLGQKSLAWRIGGNPTPETWQWWDSKKPAIMKAFEDSAQHIPDAGHREALVRQMKNHVANIESLRKQGLYGHNV